MFSLKNKVVMVTGASAGIGYSCARIFAKSGAKLILAARRSAKIKKLAEGLAKKYKTESIVLELDVRDQKQVEEKINSLPAKWKKIQILVNNAGLSRGLDKLHEGQLLDWEEMIDTNIKGLLYVSR
ncbi:MAG: NAD(P)-dependent oxidoreductase, partial [Candidatus Zixiibacteriota bacterium]